MTFEAYGYASMYIWGNTPSLIILAFVIFAFWGLSFLKDIFVNSTNRVCFGWIRDRFMLNKHSAWMTNFALRFWYEAFIFVCISALISLNKSEQENVVPELSEKHDPESEHAKIDKIVASILLSMILATLIFALWQVMAEYFLTKYSHVKKYCLDIKQSADAKADARADLKNALRMEDSQKLNLKSLFETSRSFSEPPKTFSNDFSEPIKALQLNVQSNEEEEK